MVFDDEIHCLWIDYKFGHNLACKDVTLSVPDTPVSLIQKHQVHPFSTHIIHLNHLQSFGVIRFHHY